MLRSAVANAESRPDLHWNGDDLVVVDRVRGRGPDAEALRARARGRVGRIRKRTCHITIELAQSPRRRCRRVRLRPRRSARRAEPSRSRRSRRGDCVEETDGRRDREPVEEPTAAEEPETRRRPPRRPRRPTGGDRQRRARANGSENSSGRTARRRHPRLEVELVHRQEGVRGLHPRGRPDPRAHLQEARARGAVRHPDPQGQAADHGRHLHRAPGHRDRQVGRRGRRAAQRAARADAEERPHQHQRDQAPGARREARRAVDRRAALEPRRLPPRDEARARLARSAPARPA